MSLTTPPAIVAVAPACFPADGDAIRALLLEYEAAFPTCGCFSELERELDGLPGRYAAERRGTLLVARADDRICGCVGLRQLEPAVCEMRRLYVRPEGRRGGAARELSSRLIEWARQAGYRWMRLETVPEMAAAVNLYRSLGFHEMPEPGSGKPSGEARLRFELDLEGEAAPLRPLPVPMATMETGRLRLRPLELADAPRVRQLAGDRTVARNTLSIPHPYPEGGAEAFINRFTDDYRRHGHLAFGVIPRESGVLCGCAGLSVDFQNRKAELGYWLGREYWGRGYATEAARALVGFGFGELGLRRIVARAFASNPASGRVLEKIGMRKEGCLRGHVLKWGEYEDILYYGMLAGEWPQAGNG